MADLAIINKSIASRIRFVKVFSILGIGICALVLLLFPLNFRSTCIVAFVVFFCLLSLIFHYFKLFTASRFILLHFMALVSCVSHAYQMQAGEGAIGTMVLFQVLYITLPLAVFDFSEKKSLIISVLINMAILLATPLCNDLFDAPPDVLNIKVGPVANFLYLLGGILVILPIIYSVSQSQKWMQELSNKIEENKRLNAENAEASYATATIVKFSVIMREYDNSVDELSSKSLSAMVELFKCVQGTVWVYNKVNNLLELKAQYAFDSENERTRYILPGETLAGQAFVNKKTMHITDVSADYYNIKSGLGFAKPTELLIVPAVFNDDCYGIVELASFNEFTKPEIRLIERLAQFFAATVSNVINNSESLELVEKLQMQAEELKTKEEELITNIEDLNEAQEQMELMKEKTAERIEEQMGSQRKLMEKTIAKYNETVMKLQENEYKLEVQLRQVQDELIAMKKIK